jgi:hypothetical protein
MPNTSTQPQWRPTPASMSAASVRTSLSIGASFSGR